MKDKLVEKIMIKIVWLSPNTYSYLIDDNSGDKKAKGTKECVIKLRIKFEDHQKPFKNNKIVLSQNEGLKAKYMMYFLTKLTRLYQAVMMTKLQDRIATKSKN